MLWINRNTPIKTECVLKKFDKGFIISLFLSDHLPSHARNYCLEIYNMLSNLCFVDQSASIFECMIDIIIGKSPENPLEQALTSVDLKVYANVQKRKKTLFLDF